MQLYVATSLGAVAAAAAAAKEAEQLALLEQMGFGDAAANRRLLQQCGGDVNRVVDAVLSSRPPAS